MNKWLFSVLIVTSGSLSWGEFTTALDSEETSVLSAVYLEEVQYEEPLFSGAVEQRGLAEVSSQGVQQWEWQGPLRVLDEIPFREPHLRRYQVQNATLDQLESEPKPPSE